MNNRSKNLITRRKFFSLSLAAAAAIPAGSMIRARRAAASDLPHVDPATDPVAMALGYKNSAAEVDKEAFPKIAGEPAGQICGNCMLYEGGDAEWGPCSMFPGKAVAKAGWCNAWAPKA